MLMIVDVINNKDRDVSKMHYRLIMQTFRIFS